MNELARHRTPRGSSDARSRPRKRLRRTHKPMNAYGEPWPYSVFYRTLKDIDRVRLENELREILNLKEDQVLIVDLGSNEHAAHGSAAVLGAPPPLNKTTEWW